MVATCTVPVMVSTQTAALVKDLPVFTFCPGRRFFVSAKRNHQNKRHGQRPPESGTHPALLLLGGGDGGVNGTMAHGKTTVNKALMALVKVPVSWQQSILTMVKHLQQ